ncbi:MAG: twin-arginine translocase subunit TatC [Anaerolineae bacterium]|nr:twin-arginine translocase subunit TatC [Anaerolineae bacterium]
MKAKREERNNNDLSEARMGLLEHFEELRERLIKSVIALVLAIIFSLFFTGKFLKILISPMGELKPIFLRPTEMIITYLRVAFIAGLALAMPFIVYQLIKFILPALYPHERRYLYWLIPAATLSFLAGLAFAYFVMLPFVVRYLLTFGGDLARAQWTIGEYINFVTNFLFWMGMTFELPLVIYFLSKLGLISPEWLGRNRKYAIVVIAIIAAVITPTPDPFNMSLVMIPLILLYEVGVLLSKIAR